MKVGLDLSNYATKANLENKTGVDTSAFAKKTDLPHLKSDVDKLDIDKLKHVPSGLSSLKSKVDQLNIGKLETTLVDVSKPSDVVKMKLLKRLNIMLRSKILKIKYLTLLNITNLATNAALKAKINEVKEKIYSITNLATTTLTAVENKIPNIINLVKKTDYNTKINEIEKKKKILIMVMINILLLQYLIRWQQHMLLQD